MKVGDSALRRSAKDTFGLVENLKWPGLIETGTRKGDESRGTHVLLRPSNVRVNLFSGHIGLTTVSVSPVERPYPRLETLPLSSRIAPPSWETCPVGADLATVEQDLALMRDLPCLGRETVPPLSSRSAPRLEDLAPLSSRPVPLQGAEICPRLGDRSPVSRLLPLLGVPLAGQVPLSWETVPPVLRNPCLW
ncbi:hypothetical protein AVEN_223988-1 [Araneus ventricosus]|uniref:Uncharacterized protein n=1 Tax=Araneus ventricosus TaxID=182803 RepID=A0A4Y2L1T6_ARAVE|nr:hypothetical protein AVEN_223988-1 [Araneus ventricosus]